MQALIQLTFVHIVDGDWGAALATLRDSANPLHRGHDLADAAMALDAAAPIALHADRSNLAHHATAAASRTRDRLGVAPWPTWSELVDTTHANAPTPEVQAVRETDPFTVLDGVLAEVR